MKKIIMLLSVLTMTYAQIGRQEVIGYTTFDQLCGVVYTYCRVDQIRNNIHTYWIHSSDTAGYVHPSRNQRYNFYNYNTRNWEWPGTGVNVYTQRSGYGSMDFNPVTGDMVSSTGQYIGGRLIPIIARSSVPGSDIFEYSQGPTGFQWPLIAVTNNQVIHCAVTKEDPVGGYDDTLYYLRSSSWGNWSTPILLGIPFGPSYNISASKTSNKVIITWSQWEHQGGLAAPVDSGFYRLSDDGGITWGPPTLISFPPAFRDINAIPSFYIAGFFCMFDNNDNLHMVTQVHPVFYDTLPLILPTEIWHYCPENNPAWSRIVRRTTDTIMASVGPNALFACRPSIVQNPTNNFLYACWEAFDSLNYEPTTGLLRADIWIAESPDNGQTWQNVTRITNPNTTSKRYPCVGGVINDTLVLAYQIDSIAGCSNVSNQGRITRNPVVCHWISVPLTGIEEQALTNKNYPFVVMAPTPNPFRTQTTIRYSLPIKTNVSLQIFDVTGRLIKTLVSETKPAGEYAVYWDGTNNNRRKVKGGVYFYTLKTNTKSMTRKIIKL